MCKPGKTEFVFERVQRDPIFHPHSCWLAKERDEGGDEEEDEVGTMGNPSDPVAKVIQKYPVTRKAERALRHHVRPLPSARHMEGESEAQGGTGANIKSCQRGLVPRLPVQRAPHETPSSLPTCKALWCLI